MFGVALKMVNDKDVVCDILQDVFVYYFQKSQNGSTINQPGSWLIRATINKCIDYSKSRKKYTKIEGIDPISEGQDPIDRKQDQAIITLALSKLKPQEKTLALLYSEGMSYKEIAEISGIKLSSVGKMLARTIKKLDKILEKMNYEMY
ncbi:RNA polymerase sigma-70 factor, ECF subfamily [Sunxiuqinia elliptica]|uniref:RNA polymerase sigma-70 factor, ECF subfamily n=2 Tax=Sunxiuqinia elliptica TaxID=655355 RepID=A0A1I2BXH4_9BACT|nr:RNA polymerase sigma-70 factor, ECF subfamily [Sunxiuqinia elliptica]